MHRFGFKLSVYIKAIIRSVWIFILLYRISLPDLLGKIEKNNCAVPSTGVDLDEIARITIHVCKWRLFLIRNNCLRKSLLIYTMLTEAGMKGLEINIGVSKENTELAGHGWLTLYGKPYLEEYEDILNRYSVMYKHGDRYE